MISLIYSHSLQIFYGQVVLSVLVTGINIHIYNVVIYFIFQDEWRKDNFKKLHPIFNLGKTQ